VAALYDRGVDHQHDEGQSTSAHPAPKVGGSAAHPARRTVGPLSEAERAQAYGWDIGSEAPREWLIAEINREVAAVTEDPDSAEYHAALVATYAEILAKSAKAVAEIAKRENDEL
jgi:hypothetical protein